MACKYVYQGQEFSKEEIIRELTNTMFKDLNTTNVFKSIAIKEKHTDLKTDTLTVLNQRYQDARNMVQATKNSDVPKLEKLKKISEYRKIMEKSNAARKELILLAPDQAINWVLDLALADSKVVDSLYNSDSITFNELQFAKNTVSTWVNINKSLGINTIYDVDDSTPSGKAIREKLSNIQNIYNAFDERTRSIAIELIKQSSYGQEISDADIKVLVDTSIMTKYTRELTTTGIPLANKMGYIIKDVNFKINREHANNHATIDRMTDKIKNNPLFKKEGWNLFVKTEKNKAGNQTFGLVTRYSQTFWDNLRDVNKARRERIERADGDKVKIKEAWKAYNEWNERNTVPFNSLPWLELSNHTDMERDAEIARMKSLGFNESEINTIIGESLKMYDKFLKNKELHDVELTLNVSAHPEMIPSNMTEQQFIEYSLEEYDNLNNPVKYTRQKFTPGEIITSYGGARYSYLIAAKTYQGQDLNYYDTNFAQISADPVLHEFYTWFSNFMKDNLSWLPEEEIDDLHSNFLPVIADRTAKEYGFSAMKESVKGIGDWFMNSLTDNNYGQKVETNPMSSEERRQFKARFIDENVDIKDRSKDLSIMAKLFSDMALVYKHKNTVKAELDTINQVLKGTKGSYVKNKKIGQYEATDKDATNIKDLADYTLRTGFYGMKTEDQLWKSQTKFYDWKELISLGFWKSAKAKQAKLLTDEITEMRSNLELGKVPEIEIEDTKLQLSLKEQELYKLGGRSLSLTAAIDSSINQTRLVALGLSPMAAARNLVIGKINNHIAATGGRDFNKSDLGWANRQLMSASAKYWSGGTIKSKMTNIIFGLMSDSQLAEGEDSIYLKALIDKKTPIDKVREMAPKLFTWLSSGDYHFKAETLLACMKHEQLTTANGEKISFFDALNEDREYNEEKYGAWNAKDNGGVEFEEYYRTHINKYKQVAFKTHGAVGGGVEIYAKQNAIGRVALLFKSWLAETVGNRFDPRHRDAMLQRDEEGYYRTFFTKMQEQRFGVIKTIIQTMFNKENGIEDELELANFKKFVLEMQYIVGIMIAYMMLRAMQPDDDRKRKLMNLLVLRQLNDLGRDMGYYSNISSLRDLTRDVVPIFRTMDNWYNATQAVGYHILGVENKEGDELFDSDRTLLKITKVLPVFSNINRVNYYMKEIGIGTQAGR